MPPRSRYPLDALLHRRKDLQDDKGRALADRMREASEAWRQECRAQDAEREHHDAVVEAVHSEGVRVEQGAATVQDLLIMQAWETAQAATAAVLRDKAQRAEEAARQAASAETLARGALAAAQAELDVVEQHRQRFVDALREHEQARSDEEAEESHAARAFLVRRHRRE